MLTYYKFSFTKVLTCNLLNNILVYFRGSEIISLSKFSQKKYYQIFRIQLKSMPESDEKCENK